MPHLRDVRLAVAAYYLLLAVFVAAGIAVALPRIRWTFTPISLIEFSVCAVLAAGAVLFTYIGLTELTNRG